MPKHLALAALLLALPACHPINPDTCDAAEKEDATLRFGVGYDRWTEVADGDEVGLVWGSQGGLMIEAGLRVTGLVTGGALAAWEELPLVTYEVYEGDTQVGGHEDIAFRFHAAGDGTQEMLGDQVVLGGWGNTEVIGKTVTLRARVVDGCGREVSGEREVVLVE